MKKISNLNGDFEYELLDENQQDTNLREKLIGLYSTYFSDILWWELNDPSLVSSGYYKLFYYEQSVLKHIILFKYSIKEPKKIVLLNAEFNILLKDIENISHVLFAELKKVQQIIFKNVFIANPVQSPKMILEKAADDVIIDLPNSMEGYMKSLGSNFRKNTNRCINHIIRDFPDYKIRCFEKSDILFDDIRNLVLLGKSRMKAKGVNYSYSEMLSKQLHQYVSMSGFGLLCVCEIDDKIVAGEIITVIGEHAYAHLGAHDESYNKYSMGIISTINAIRYLIEEKKDVKYFHFLGGTVVYKVRFGGVVHDLYTFKVFRNNGIIYFWSKITKIVKVSCRKFKQRLQNNNAILSIVRKMNKMRMKIQGK